MGEYNKKYSIKCIAVLYDEEPYKMPHKILELKIGKERLLFQIIPNAQKGSKYYYKFLNFCIARAGKTKVLSSKLEDNIKIFLQLIKDHGSEFTRLFPVNEAFYFVLEEAVMMTNKKVNKIEGKVFLTLSCNQDCVYCDIKKGNVSPTLGRIKEELRNFKKKHLKDLKKVRISFTGGEPTSSKNLIPAIKYARTLGFPELELMTNGLLLDEEAYVKKLYKAGLTKIMVSFNSHKPEINAKTTGKKNTHNKLVKACKNILQQPFKRVVFNMPLTTMVYKTIPGYLKFITTLPRHKDIELSFLPTNIQRVPVKKKYKAISVGFDKAFPIMVKALEENEIKLAKCYNGNCKLECFLGSHFRNRYSRAAYATG
jgi:sulfatase maturation enzyme AslB (radical SAM superfamily)